MCEQMSEEWVGCNRQRQTTTQVTWMLEHETWEFSIRNVELWQNVTRLDDHVVKSYGNQRKKMQRPKKCHTTLKVNWIVTHIVLGCNMNQPLCKTFGSLENLGRPRNFPKVATVSKLHLWGTDFSKSHRQGSQGRQPALAISFPKIDRAVSKCSLVLKEVIDSVHCG